MDVNNLYFYILKCYVGGHRPEKLPFEGISLDEWERLYDLSKAQGTAAFVFEVIKTLPKEVMPPRPILMKWFSRSSNIEKRMREMFALAADYAQQLHERSIPLVVLKGFAFSTFYPHPFYREYGDLDAYMPEKAQEGDAATVELGGTAEEGGYKHSHLSYRGLTIENHYFLTGFNRTRKGNYTERLLRRLVVSGWSLIGDTKLLMPNAAFNAFFLLKHAQNHFLLEGLRMKHFLDWAFFLKAEQHKVNWDTILPEMERAGLLRFSQVMTCVCVEKLGIEVEDSRLCNDALMRETTAMREAMVRDTLGEQPDVFDKNIVRKGLRILRRFGRLWKFRELSDENVFLHIWNTFAFSSYLHRKVSVEEVEDMVRD